MVYQENGLPIFSKCYSGFCGLVAKEPVLLSGFITALQGFATEISDPISREDSAIQAITMGHTVLRFKKTLPTGHLIAVGLSEDRPDIANDIFNEVETLLEKKYGQTNWAIIDTDFGKEFEQALLEEALIPALHQHGGFEDRCPRGDMCPMRILPTVEKKSIWTMLKDRYHIIRKRMRRM